MKTPSLLWAVSPEAVSTVLEMMKGVRGSVAQMPKPSTQGRGPNKLAVIPIHGILTSDGPAYYGSTYGDIADAVEKAASDPDVKHIVLSVDSPGGEVTGLPETTAVIAAAARVKPVSAIVEGTSASAAYWLTSQAHHIALTPSGEVGSVGVRMMHVDMSKALDDAGLKITELQSGKYKTEWSPNKPLSEDAQADMQPRLDSVHRDFINAVASGRGRRATAAITKERFGEGRMFSGRDALANGMVDRLVSSRDFYRGLLSGDAPPVTAPTGAVLAPRRLERAALTGTADIAIRRARLEIERLRL